MASRAPSKLLVTKIGGLLDCLDYQFQIFPPISHAMLHPWQILGQAFCMISGLFPSWSIHDYRQKSTVQSPESSKIVQKNTPKLTAEPLLLWINESPESRIMDFWTAPESRQSSSIDQSTIMSPLLAEWLFLWICGYFTNYSTNSGTAIGKNTRKVFYIDHADNQESWSDDWLRYNRIRW